MSFIGHYAPEGDVYWTQFRRISDQTGAIVFLRELTAIDH